MTAKNVCIVQKGHWVTLTAPKRRTPARRGGTVQLLFQRRSISKNRVRFQFMKAKTGRVCWSSVIPRLLMIACERGAQKLNMPLGLFIIAGFESDPAVLKALQGNSSPDISPRQSASRELKTRAALDAAN